MPEQALPTASGWPTRAGASRSGQERRDRAARASAGSTPCRHPGRRRERCRSARRTEGRITPRPLPPLPLAGLVHRAGPPAGAPRARPDRPV